MPRKAIATRTPQVKQAKEATHAAPDAPIDPHDHPHKRPLPHGVQHVYNGYREQPELDARKQKLARTGYDELTIYLSSERAPKASPCNPDIRRLWAEGLTCWHCEHAGFTWRGFARWHDAPADHRRRIIESVIAFLLCPACQRWFELPEESLHR